MLLLLLLLQVLLFTSSLLGFSLVTGYRDAPALWVYDDTRGTQGKGHVAECVDHTTATHSFPVR
jgi:hypothetical protein